MATWLRGTSSHVHDLEPTTAQMSEWSHSDSRRTWRGVWQDSGSGRGNLLSHQNSPRDPSRLRPPPDPYRRRRSRAQYEQPAAHSRPCSHAASLAPLKSEPQHNRPAHESLISPKASCNWGCISDQEHSLAGHEHAQREPKLEL